MAKAPVPGRVKTRLCPPLDHVGAADVAAAALADTLDAVAACGADRRVLALDGAPGAWLPDGFEVLAQRGAGLAERLAAAWSDAGAAGLQIGMDTPQAGPDLLDDALEALRRAMARRPPAGAGAAVLGTAVDGGWWAIGLSRPEPAVFEGVPMSTPATGAAQRHRLEALGWSVDPLPVLRDLDTAEDLSAIAADAPETRTATVAARLAGAISRPGVHA